MTRKWASIQNNVPLLRRSSADGNPKHCLPFRQAVAHRGGRWGVAVYVLACAIFATGCSATSNLRLPIADDVTPKREARNEQFVEEFEQRRNEAELHAAMNHWQQGDTDACHTALKNILERDPENRDSLLLMANSLLSAEKPQEALPHIKTAALAHPNNPDVQYTMAIVLEATNQPDVALAYYERAVELDPDNDTYRTHYEAAIESACHDNQHTPNNPDNPPKKITVATSADTVEKALTGLRNAIARNPNNPQIPIAAAVSALRTNQPTLAVRLIEDQLSSFPKSVALRQTLATAYYRSGNYPASQVVLQQALSLDNSNGLSYFLMGCTLAKLGQFDASQEHFRKAREIDPRLGAK